MFGSTSAFSTTASTNNNAMKYVEVKSPPDDSVSCIKFSPTSTGTSSFLIAGSWDTNHDAPIKTVHWIKAPNYSCIMTGGWDKLLKFWDTRSPTPMDTIQLPERCYCADVVSWLKTGLELRPKNLIPSFVRFIDEQEFLSRIEKEKLDYLFEKLVEIPFRTDNNS